MIMILVPVALYHWCFSTWTLYSKGCGAVTNESHEIMSCWVSRNLILGWLKKTALWGIWSFAKTAAASEPFLAVGLGWNFGDSWGFGRWQDSSLVSSRFCSGFMLGTGAQRHGSWEVSPSSLVKTFGPTTWCQGQGEMPSTHRTSGPCFVSFREGYVADFESSHGFC